MTQEVMVTISGEQIDIEENEKTELITTGTYFLKNGKHYILYDETQPDENMKTSSTIKMTKDCLEVIRKGANQNHMVFEEGKQRATCYQTMMGMMTMDIFTDSLKYTEREDLIEAVAEYSLSVNELFVSRCRAVVRIQPKENATIHLMD